MRYEDYKSNEGSKVGGALIYNESARDVLRTIASYDDGGLCQECHYFDEAGNEMKKADFETHFLKIDDSHTLIDPPCDCFEVKIDQSNKPQTLLVRPKPTTRDKSKKVARWLKKRF